MGWVALCVEAIVAAPLWLISHAMPEGEGFAGSAARSGYAMFFSLLFRPILLILSMFVCMIVMSATGPLIGLIFTPFAEGLRGVSGNYGITGVISLVIMLGAVISLFTWKMFSLTTQMADRILRWVGQLIANLGDENAQGMIQESRAGAQHGAQKFADGVKGAVVANTGGKEQGQLQKASQDAKNEQHMAQPITSEKNVKI